VLGVSQPPPDRGSFPPPESFFRVFRILGFPPPHLKAEAFSGLVGFYGFLAPPIENGCCLRFYDFAFLGF
jgi:hypothetical protein